MAKRLQSPESSFPNSISPSSNTSHTDRRVRSRLTTISELDMTSDKSASNTVANIASPENSSKSVRSQKPLHPSGRVSNEKLCNTDFNTSTTSKNTPNSKGISSQFRQLKMELNHENQIYQKHTQLLANSAKKIKRIQENIDWLSKNQQQSVHKMVQQPMQQYENQPEQQLNQQPIQQLVRQSAQQSVHRSVQQSLQPSSQQPIQQLVLQLMQQSVNQLVQQSVQSLTQQSVQPVGQQPGQLPIQKSVQLIQDLVQQSTQQHISNTSSSSHLLSTSLKNEYELLSSPLKYHLDESGTLTSKSLDYVPRRALVYQFGNMDRQTTIAYGDEQLQLWDPIDQKIIGAWSGVPENIYIEQAEPVAASMVAIVSRCKVSNNNVSGAGRLFFMNSNWSTSDGRFSKMSYQPWVGNAQPGTALSIVEGIDSGMFNDGTRASLFTGAISGGAVYRRIFDISESNVTTISRQRMDNRHRGTVSALCHVQAQNYVVSGSTFGDIHLNDHGNGKCTQTIKLGEGSTVGSITRCHFNPSLFMVGYCHPRNELMVFDSRLGSNMGAPVMTLKDAGNQITSRYNRPAWDAETGLICSPVRRYVDGRDTTMINVWDPRFIKCSDADNFMLYRNKHEVLSVDFTKSMVGKDRIMVTASEDNVGFTPFTLKRS